VLENGNQKEGFPTANKEPFEGRCSKKNRLLFPSIRNVFRGRLFSCILLDQAVRFVALLKYS